MPHLTNDSISKRPVADLDLIDWMGDCFKSLIGLTKDRRICAMTTENEREKREKREKKGVVGGGGSCMGSLPWNKRGGKKEEEEKKKH